MKRIITVLFVLAPVFLQARDAVQLPQSGPAMASGTFSEYMSKMQKEALKRRDALFAAATASPAAMKAYVEECRGKYATLVGEFPQKCELDARVTGVVQESGWRVEKLVFQSIPGRYVTALLFLPQTASAKHPVPCVVHTCGHTDTGKRSYAAAASYLAGNGIACFVVDPFGQGERIQEIDAAGKSLTRGPTTEHGLENFGCLLAGTPLFARILWDNMRAVDCLQERPDIDSSRLGAVGTSGAGVQTLLFAACDSRIKAAAMSSSIAWGFAGTGLDGCGLIPGIAAEGISLTDIATTIAPRPILYMNGQKDYVKIEDGRKAIAQIRSSFELQGASADDVRMVEVPSAHSYYVPGKQEAMVKFFCAKLLGKESVKWNFPGDITASTGSDRRFPSEKFNCTSSGQVLTEYSDARSLYNENLSAFEDFEASREEFLSGPESLIREKVCALIGYSKSKDKKVKVEYTSTSSYEGYSFTSLRLSRDGRPQIPCSLIVPEGSDPAAPLRLWLYDGGMDCLLRSPAHIRMACEGRGPVLIADLCGLGQTGRPVFISGNFKSWNDEYSEFTAAMFLGTTIVGQRVADIETILDFCAMEKGLKGREVKLSASGDCTVPALHAAYLDDRISETVLMHGVKSWRFCLYPLQKDICGIIVPGAIRYYDLPELSRLCPGKVKYYD